MHRVCPIRGGIAALGLLALISPPAAAQKTSFNPSVSLNARYSDNLEYVEEDGTDDSATRLSLDLPLARETATGTLSLRYQPSYIKYRDEDDLDHDEHVADLDWATRLGPKSALGLAASFSRTQAQAATGISERPEVEDTDLLLTERTDRDSFGASLRFDRTEGPRWGWRAALNWVATSHDEIAEAPSTTVTGFEVEDRTEYGASIEALKSLSRSNSIGLRYEHRKFDLDRSPDEDTDSISLTYREELARKLSFELGLGAARTTGDAAGGSEGDEDRTDFLGSLGLSRAFRRVRLQVTASHRPTSGGHLEGSSTNTGLGLALSGAQSREWGWNVYSRYAHRKPTDDASESIDTLAFGADVERKFARVLGIRLGGNYVDQSSDESGLSDSSAYTIDLGVVWYPRGRAAQGESR